MKMDSHSTQLESNSPPFGPRSPAALFSTAALLVVGIVQCLPVLTSGMRWGLWDWDLFEVLMETARASILDWGQLPAWNPYVRGGESLVANPLLPIWSPSFLAVLAFGTIPGIKLWVVVRQLVALFGSYLLGRRLGFTHLAAVTAAFVFGLASTYGQRVGHGHWNLQAFVYLPWVIWAGLDAIRSGSWRAQGFAAVVLSLMFLEGGPYSYMMGFFGLAALAAIAAATGAHWRMVAVPLLIGVLSLSLSAIKAVPVADVYGGGAREIPYARGEMLDFYDPTFEPSAATVLHAALLSRSQANRPGRWPTFQINVGAYVGPIGLALAALGVVVGGSVGRGAVLLAVPVLWLCLGAAAPVNLWALLHTLPVFSSMLVPAKFTPCYLLALAVAAGAAVQFLQRRFGNSRVARFALLGAVALLAADLMIVARPLFVAAFPVPPLELERGEFHQKLHNPYSDAFNRRVELDIASHPASPDGTGYAISTLFPAVLGNHGVLRTLWIHPLRRTGAHPDLNGRLQVALQPKAAGPTPQLLDWSPSRLELSVAPTREAWLLVNANYAPGWRAQSDVGTLPVRAWHRRLAVKLTAGTRHVVLSYRPTPFRLGALVSLAAALLVGVMLARRSPAE